MPFLTVCRCVVSCAAPWAAHGVVLLEPLAVAACLITQETPGWLRRPKQEPGAWVFVARPKPLAPACNGRPIGRPTHH